MKIIDENLYKFEFSIKKSTFIAIGKKITTKEEMNIFLEEYSEPLATHNCYAYRIGINNQQAGYNDDGEPKGTAGVPILNIIKKHDLTNIIILVIRFYGGIKLGAGPLMRSYGQAANGLFDTMQLNDIKIYNEIKISFPIQIIKEVDNIIHNNQYELINKTFTENVEYTFLTIYPNLPIFINKEIKIISTSKTYK